MPCRLTQVSFPPPGTKHVVQTPFKLHTNIRNGNILSSYEQLLLHSLGLPPSSRFHVFVSCSPSLPQALFYSPLHFLIPNSQTIPTFLVQIPHLPLHESLELRPRRDPMAPRGAAVASRRATLAPRGTTLGPRARLPPPPNFRPQAQNSSPGTSERRTSRRGIGVRSHREDSGVVAGA